jgi:predicted nucleic acid-binding protein
MAASTKRFGYFDTSALMRLVEHDVPLPSALNSTIAPQVDRLLGDSTVTLAISELTILEFRSAVTQDWRRIDAQCSQFDASWAGRAKLRLMQLIANGEVQVVPAPLRAAEHAVLLVDMAAIEHNVALGTWDAIHIVTAVLWSHTVGQLVHLYTSDDDFDEFLGHYPYFGRFVNAVDLSKSP